MTPNFQRGKSLFELMATLAILAVISAISIPNAIGLLTENKLAQTTKQTLVHLNSLAEIARKTNRTVAVELDKKQQALVTSFEPSADDIVHYLAQKDLRLPKNVAIDLMKFATIDNQPTRLLLYPSGAANPGTIIFSQGNRRCTLTQSLRGLRRYVCNF